MNAAPAKAPECSTDAVLRSALRAFAAFPGPGLACFAMVAVWNCYDGAGGDLDITSLSAGSVAFETFLSLAGSLVIGWMMCGLTRVAIRGARGEAATWNDTVVSLWEYFHAASALGTWLTVGLLGLLLFVVPGVMVLLMWSQAFCCAIDCKERWITALGHSRQITKGHYPLLVGVSFASMLLLLPGWAISASTMFNSMPDLDALLGGAAAASPHLPQATFDPAAAAMTILAAALGAGAYTAMSYVGAALYVALQDAWTSAHATKRPSGLEAWSSLPQPDRSSARDIPRPPRA